MANVPGLETIKIDFEPKGVNFYYIYKPLAHPELNNYISPFNIEERLMHVAEAKRRLGSEITWLADSMDNAWHNAMGQTPNSEVVIGPDGLVLARRAWSDPEMLRVDLEQIVGPVENPTTIEDLDLPTQPPRPTVAKGVVPRVNLPEDSMPMLIEPHLGSTRAPFYAKLRAEGPPALYKTGSGTMYIGFHLDPLYQVHWNNEAPPIEFTITAPGGVMVSPASMTGPNPQEPADADPREFLIDVSGASPGEQLEVEFNYYACDDALTFCIPVKQSYTIMLAPDTSHGWSMPTDADGNVEEMDRMPSFMRRARS